MAKGSRRFKKSLTEVYNASVKALHESGFIIEEKDEKVIRATSDISIVSWGEEIEIKLYSKPDGVEVEATSEAYQLFDWGKSEENLSRFFANLEKHLAKE